MHAVDYLSLRYTQKKRLYKETPCHFVVLLISFAHLNTLTIL